MRWWITHIILFLILIVQSGCGSFGQKMKSWLSGSDPAPTENRQEVKYSQQRNVGTPVKRNYGRMNRERLEREAHLDSQSGSLWVMEGQGAYLFSENIMRMVGDSINVRLEGAPRKQVETKVAVIKKLLKRLYQPPPPVRSLASASEKDKKKKDSGKKEKGSKSEAEEKKEPSEEEKNARAQQEEMSHEVEKSEFEVESVPSKIIERMSDGNYKIRGSESFMIGNREYKVMVSGIVRSEDFSIEGVSASQLLEPSFDVVSLRRNIRQ